MRGKLRSIHTLDVGDAIAEITGMRYEQCKLKHISSFTQVIKKEVGAGIFSCFIIAKATLPFITA